MAYSDLMISYEEWKEDPINQGCDFSDYINEVGLYDAVEFYDSWISQTELSYLEARKNGHTVLVTCLAELLRTLREKRQSEAQKKGNG